MKRAAGKTIVFVGPTLPAAEVGARGFEVRGPVRMGEVLALARARVKVRRIAIIDGYFEGMAAVWHKEILCALEVGIAVWGAASMGALRAAELAPFGMRGVGAVYERFARGATTDLLADDEVAVAHLPAAQGYAAVTVALVDVRAHAASLRPARANIVIEAARARHYRERVWSEIVSDARRAGLGEHELAGLGKGDPPGTKAADARLLLDALQRDRSRSRRTGQTPRTWALRVLHATIPDHGRP